MKSEMQLEPNMMHIESNKFVDLEIRRENGRYCVAGQSFATRHCAELLNSNMFNEFFSVEEI